MLQYKDIYRIYGDGSDLKMKAEDGRPRNFVSFSTTIITNEDREEIYRIQDKYEDTDNIYAELAAMYNGLLYMYNKSNTEFTRVVCYLDNQIVMDIVMMVPLEDTAYGRICAKYGAKETSINKDKGKFSELVEKTIDLLNKIKFDIQCVKIKSHSIKHNKHVFPASLELHSKCDSLCSTMRKEYLYQFTPEDILLFEIKLTTKDKVMMGILPMDEIEKRREEFNKKQENARCIKFTVILSILTTMKLKTTI